ncbi:MAG: hypothetical protein ACTH2Q_02515 [Propionibacteriaceae bacterium]
MANEDTGRMPLQWSAGSTTVSLGWWSPDDNVEWTVSRDGEFITTTTGTTLHVTDAARSSASYYTVEGRHRVTTTDGQEADQPYFYGVAIPAADNTSLGQNIQDSALRGPDQNKDLAGSVPNGLTELMVGYSTFIPDRYLASPFVCNLPDDNREVAHYGGDGRTWHGTELARTTADASGAQAAVIDNPLNGTARMAFLVDTSNPLCFIAGVPAPAINGDIDVTVDATGYMNHRYDGDGRSGHGCAYRRQVNSCKHLFPTFPNAVVDVTWNAATGAHPDCPIVT